MTDGRCVVIKSNNVLLLYNSNGEQADVKFDLSHVGSTPHMPSCPTCKPQSAPDNPYLVSGMRVASSRPPCTCPRNHSIGGEVCSLTVDGDNHIYVLDSTHRGDRGYPFSSAPSVFSPQVTRSVPRCAITPHGTNQFPTRQPSPNPRIFPFADPFAQVQIFHPPQQYPAAVPGNPSSLQSKNIQVFTPAGGQASGKIYCPENIKPVQIFAMKSQERLLVKDGDFIVKVMDKSGMPRFTITTEIFSAHAFPALSHDDSVLIAWVNHSAGIVTINRYTSDLKNETTLIANHKIEKSSKRCWYSLQEFTTGELALCTTDRLYIFRNS